MRYISRWSGVKEQLWFAPLALVVFLREEDVAVLRPRDAAEFVALCFVARGGEVEIFMVLAEKHGRVVGTPRIENLHLLHGIARAFFLEPGRIEGSGESVAGHLVVGHRVEGDAELFGSLFVVAVLHQLPCEGEVGVAVGLLVSDDIAVGGYRFLGGVDFLVAESHLLGYLASAVTHLGGSLRVGGLVFGSSIVILTQSEVFLTPLQVLVCSARRGEQHGKYQCR